jgi:hypothetical protein
MRIAMHQTDNKQFTTTLTTSLVKEFRLLQALVDTLRDERLAFNERSEESIAQAAALKESALQDLVTNADQRYQYKETLARLLGLDPEISCRDLANALGEEEASQILNLIEGSLALWKMAADLNKSNQQFIRSTFAAAGVGDPEAEGVTPSENGYKVLQESFRISQRIQDVFEWISGKYL